ncbi:hypothetical protein ACHAXR_001754, partial [Thalassiosira sp. AJA248-18]
MKLSIIALAALISSTGAFAPVQTSVRNTALYAVAGDEIREARSSYAQHGTGEIGSGARMTPKANGNQDCVMGEDVRHARPTYAAHGTGEIGSGERMAPKAVGNQDSVMGEDVRHARPTYAAHGTGEIGSGERMA